MADKNIYTVIVADDEDELREAVCTMIPWEALGFHLVGSASNGLDALELVERLEPDLLLTDIRMPFISGIELARQVREIRPAMHRAFLSGLDDFEYAKQAIQYNIISYMLKPLTMDGLAAELKSIHEKIDARYAGLRRADTAHADRAAFLIPLVLEHYDSAPDDLEDRLRNTAAELGLLRGTDDCSALVVLAAVLDGPTDYEAGFTQLVEQSANKYLRHFVFYCCGRVVAVLLGGWLLGTVAGANGYAANERISSMWALFGEYWAALFCLLGHMFPCMFHFKGGKGILSGGTIVWMIDWRIGLVVWVGFLLLFLLTKYVSLGSVWAGASFPFATWYFYPDPVIVLLAFLLGALILWKHRSNIVRLIHGNENKFSVHRKKN